MNPIFCNTKCQRGNAACKALGNWICSARDVYSEEGFFVNKMWNRGWRDENNEEFHYEEKFYEDSFHRAIKPGEFLPAKDLGQLLNDFISSSDLLRSMFLSFSPRHFIFQPNLHQLQMEVFAVNRLTVHNFDFGICYVLHFGLSSEP
jgi:hypothetical protein